MSMFYHDKARCIKSLTAARSLLSECLRSCAITHKANRIGVALLTLELVLKANDELKYDKTDILLSESSYFKKRQVTYISGFSGKMRKVSFQQAMNMKRYVTLNNEKRSHIALPSTFKLFKLFFISFNLLSSFNKSSISPTSFLLSKSFSSIKIADFSFTKSIAFTY